MLKTLHSFYPGVTKRVATVLGLPQSPSINQDGGILFDGDDWTYYNWAADPDAQQFAINWLAAMGAKPGDSVIYGTNTMIGGLVAWMASEGYNMVDSLTVPFNAFTYNTYKVAIVRLEDVVWIPETYISYVQQGGSVYLQGGTSTPPLNNIFPNAFGVNYGSIVTASGGVTPGTGLFTGVGSLPENNPNELSLIGTQSTIIWNSNTYDVMATYKLAYNL